MPTLAMQLGVMMKKEERITFKQKPDDPITVKNILHPIVKEWFFSRFKEFSLPQLYGVMEIHSRNNILVSAPTGATKTLTGFLSIINELVDASEKGILEDRTYAVYVSPLRALSYDIQHNLKEPLKEIEAIAGKRLKIRVGARTGDTTPAERAKMAKIPPHIMITTPESLAIMLQTKSFREHFRNVEWLIVDEIHALAENKRGTHLSLTMEMLQRLCPGVCRVGLSATVAPLEDVAGFLVGTNRNCKIVDVQFLKNMDLKVLSPVPDLINTTFAEMESKTYKLIDSLIQDHKTTLIFTNTRAATERVVHNLKEKFPQRYTDVIDVLTKEDDKDFEAELELNGDGNLDIRTGESQAKKGAIGAHHGSLSKTHRHKIEDGLRKGKLKCVVCSTSLELGIDIGFIDLVILLGSPKSVARALQRVGRSGHQLHSTTKGRIIVTDRDDLVECSVLLKSAVDKKIDRIHIPKNALDVLAQQIYGICISERLQRKDLLEMIRASYCYSDLSNDDFDEVIRYLSGDYISLEDRHVYAKIWYDPETGMMGRKGKLARVIYMTNIGTIPDETSIQVKIGAETIGTIEESFLERLKRGDVFVLGGNTYQFLFSRGMVAQVSNAIGKRPTVPSWFSEMLPLSYDLAMEIGRFRKLIDEKLRKKQSKKELIDFINNYTYVDKYAAEAIYQYMNEQYNMIGIPSENKIIIEHYQDADKKYYVFHTLFGRRVNDCLSRAVAYAIARTQKKDVEIGITDNGFYLGSKRSLMPQKALSMLDAKRLREMMDIALDKSQVLSRRFRHCAARALMILRSYKGERKRVGRQQVSSMILMASVRRISNQFPILKEARREVLEDLMDIEHATEVLERISNNRIKIEYVESRIPSPFAFNLILQGFLDILKMEDKLAFLKRMHQMVQAEIALKKGKKGMREGQGQEETDLKIPEPIPYDVFWKEEETKKEEKKLDKEGRLHHDLDVAARRVGLDANTLYEAHRLIDGDTKGFKQEFISWLEGLLEGTIPKIWSDELVKFFRDRIVAIT